MTACVACGSEGCRLAEVRFRDRTGRVLRTGPLCIPCCATVIAAAKEDGFKPIRTKREECLN